MNCRLLLLAPFLLTLGCSAEEVDHNAPPTRVPVKGMVLVDGKPIQGAVVVYLPAEDGKGTLTQGETGEDGSYELLYATQPGGTAPGKYKVIVSYLVAADGTPQGLGPRSAMIPPKGMAEAKELLPAKYSDPTRTELTADVPVSGGPIEHDLDGPLAPHPAVPATGSAPLSENPPPPSKAEEDTPLN